MGVKPSLLFWCCFAFSFVSTETTPDLFCCQKKVIRSGPYEGTYIFSRKFEGKKDSNCADACIYKKDGSPDDEFCFKAVSSGEAEIDDQCDATPGPSTPGSSSPGPSSPGPSSPGPSSPGSSPPGSSPPGSSPPGSSPPGSSSPGSSPTGLTSPGTSPTGSVSSGSSPSGSSSPAQSSTDGSTATGTTLDPSSQIALANQEIQRKNEQMAVASTQKKAASDANAAVDGIANAMAGTRVQREKRSDATTYAPISSCEDFERKYNSLLDTLKAGLTDEKIPEIIALVSVLKVELPDVTICSPTQKSAINTNSKAKVAAAKAAATSYTQKKDEEITKLVKEVKEAQAVIKQANAALAASGQSTIPANTIPDSIITPSPVGSTPSSVGSSPSSVGSTPSSVGSSQTGTGRPSPPTGTGSPSQQTGTGRPSQPTGTGRPTHPLHTGRPTHPTGTGRPTHPLHTGRPTHPTGTGRPTHPLHTGRPTHPTGTGRPRPPLSTFRPLMTTRAPLTSN